MHGKDKFKRIVMVVVALCLSAAAPAAQADRVDVFNVSTPRPTTPAKPTAQVKIPAVQMPPLPRPYVSVASQPQEWFDAVDAYVATLKPSNADRVIMNQPFNQEVERVNEFCSTTAKIARNYRILAKKLSELPIPRSVPQAQQYRDMHVNWYNDSALLYEDMIRPRRPARTKEELAAIMKDLTDRSQGLADTYGTLQIMDLDIRKKCGVRPAKHEDALHQYTTSPTI